MRRASKPPSEWLKLLCKDWAAENEDLVENTDSRFIEYKPYTQGMLSPQLLCRLSIPASKDSNGEIAHSMSSNIDFWGILGIEDEFDKSFIVAQIEKFSALYNIRNPHLDDVDGLIGTDFSNADPATLAAAAAGLNASPGTHGFALPAYMNDSAAAAIAASAAAHSDISKLNKKQVSEVSKAHRMAKDAEKALDNERKLNAKKEQRRVSQERKEQKVRERETQAVKKAAERAAREASREERRRKKLEIREQREKFAQEQKEAALRRAAELVQSNRVPIEITRGAAAAKAASAAIFSSTPQQHQLQHQQQEEEDDDSARKKLRSAIVVSTAGDLHQIVMHSKNLFAKYSAIAKEHNQKVNWITVAKELGIHVKVREKYARMHSRAEQRGFDWQKNAHWKIKDHPEIFLEPTQAEQKAKMPPPPPPESQTVLINGTKEVTDDAVAAAASVVDATVTSPPVDAIVETNEEHSAAAAAVAATLVADPTAHIDSTSV